MTNKKDKIIKSKLSKTNNRLFLVVADDSKELHQALYYAARRAATAGGEIALFRCIEPIEGQLCTLKPKTFVRKGTVSQELFKLINTVSAIRVLVLGVSTENGNPGPLINYIINNGSNECRVPITIVPGNLSDEQIDALI